MLVNNDFGVGSVNGSSGSGSNWLGSVASVVDAATDIWNNERNIAFQKETNQQNLGLTREQWQREDTAVQRRVADLKAAGLSPTLAAGSAAASGSAAQMVAPKSNLKGGYGQQTLAALNAVNVLKNQQLQNELLQKQISYFGYPDWFVAFAEMFGADQLKDWMKGVGSYVSDLFKGLAGTFGAHVSEPSVPPVPNSSKEDYTVSVFEPKSKLALDQNKREVDFVLQTFKNAYGSNTPSRRNLIAFLTPISKQYGISVSDLINMYYNL